MRTSKPGEGIVAFSKALMTALWLTVSADKRFLYILGTARRESTHPRAEVGCLVLSREWGNGLWRLLLGIISGLLLGSIPPFPTRQLGF